MSESASNEVQRVKCSIERTASNKVVRKLTVDDEATSDVVNQVIDMTIDGMLYLDSRIKSSGIEQ